MFSESQAPLFTSPFHARALSFFTQKFRKWPACWMMDEKKRQIMKESKLFTKL